jgi:hypothetical protein
MVLSGFLFGINKTARRVKNTLRAVFCYIINLFAYICEAAVGLTTRFVIFETVSL